MLENNELATLYESKINKKQDLLKIKQQMEKDKIKVIKLYGKNGILWKIVNFVWNPWQIIKNLV